MALVVRVSDGSAATFVVTNVNDSGAGSLRQAILDANASPGADVVQFAIPGSGVWTISPVSALPPILEAVVIDGRTQAGYAGQPMIELNGSSAGNNSGLRVLAGGSTIRGLAINRFGGSGIQIEGPGTNVIQGNRIGTDPGGTVARPNGLEGIWLYNSSGNHVGGANPGEGNLVSGNGDSGIYVQNGAGNVIEGNLIGVTGSGVGALGNANNGITVYNAPGNQIGRGASGARNVISGNHASGVYLNGPGATGNLVQGNRIGTSVAGTTAISNRADGITLNGAGGNVIGGTNSGEGNLISGNGKAGIGFIGAGAVNNSVQGNLIGTELTGRFALGNRYAGVLLAGAISNLVGGSTVSARNVISGNQQDGVFLSTNSAGNTVSGNLIGLDVTGANAVANLFNGISVSSANSNLIGGVVPGARNAISGNAIYGIQMAYGSSGNCIQGNFIGPDVTGSKAVSNGRSGVRVETANNVIGGVTDGARNVLSGNGLDGVVLVGASASNNVVQGNFIGTTAAGSGALPNGRGGIGISGAPYNSIGGASAGAGNVLSANTEAGVYLIDATATGNQITGNIIGSDVGGSLALGNGLEGVYLEDASGNIIGGSVAGAGNLISANHTRGVFLTNSSWNVIEGNLIGTKLDGINPLGNVFHNVELESGATNNTIGGAGAAGNRIAFAQGIYAGLRIRYGSANNRIAGNAMFGNGALGIDLGPAGVTPNDPCDTDTGANNLQNFPVLAQAVSGNGATAIRGTLDSVPGRSYALQFFANPTCDESANGEGQVYLGDGSLSAAGNCSGSFSVTLPVSVPVGFVVTATATDSANNTSEFSACIAVAEAPALVIQIGPDQQASLSWTNTVSGFVLKQADSVAPPARWTTVTNQAVSTNGVLVVILPAAAGSRFYKLSYE